MAEKSRRELIEEAFDAEEQDSAAGSTEAPDTRASSESQPDTQADDTGQREGGAGEGEAGAEAKGEVDEQAPKKEAKKPPQQKPETPDQKEAKAAQAAQRPDPSRAASVTDRPPNSWKPAAREEWAGIPARARAEISRREKEIQQELSQTATIRRFSQDLAGIIQPHLDVINSQGLAPLQAIDTLLKASTLLYRGNAEQKAREIARIMNVYGIDVRVLDKVLSSQPIPPNMIGGANGSGAPASDPNSIPNWAKPLFNFVTEAQQAKQQRLEALNAEANAEVEQGLEKFQFLNDLRQDVADILETAARRGRVMSLEEAYNRAVALDPEVSQIVAQQRTARTQGQDLQRQRRAASTVRGTPRGPAKPAGSGPGGKTTRRDAIEEAWDNQS
jgi:hypothetical protein